MYIHVPVIFSNDDKSTFCVNAMNFFVALTTELSAKTANFCTMQKFPTIWYIDHTNLRILRVLRSCGMIKFFFQDNYSTVDSHYSEFQKKF